MTPADIAHGLRRFADYSQGVTQADRDLARAAADAIPTEAIPARDMQSLLDLVTLLSDPTRTKQHLEKLITATADAAATIHAASEATAALEAKRAEFEAEHSAHRQKLEREAGAHAADLHRRTRAVEGQEIAAAELLAKATADAAAAAELQSDLQGRLDAMQKLATK